MEGRRIKELRLGLRLSQERFAQLIGVSLQTVRRWEEGLTRPLPMMNLKLEELQRKSAAKIGTRRDAQMSGEKREPGGDFGLGGLFKGIGNFIDLLSRMAEEGTKEYTRSGELEGLDERLRGMYGFSVRMGLEGRPIVEQFGNIRATETGAVVEEVREPMVDVFDEGEHLTIIAELPGVEQSDIHIKVKDDILELSAEGEHRKYSKEVLLPAQVDESSMETSYKNGVLEARFHKRK